MLCTAKSESRLKAEIGRMDLDYEKHPVIGRPPSTLHEHFRVDNLGCADYRAFCRMKDEFDSLETFLKKWHSGK